MKAFVFLVSCLLTVAAHAEIKTVDSVEPNKFVGTWYRIAANPNFFEPATGCARQVLFPRPDGKVGVYNTGNRDNPSGELLEYHGYAEPKDSSFTKLEVHFDGVSQTGAFWVVGLDAGYQWTVVTDNLGYTLYVMSRNPTLDSASYQAALAAATSAGVSVDRLKTENQTGCQYPPVPSMN